MILTYHLTGLLFGNMFGATFFGVSLRFETYNTLACVWLLKSLFVSMCTSWKNRCH